MCPHGVLLPAARHFCGNRFIPVGDCDFRHLQTMQKSHGADPALELEEVVPIEWIQFCRQCRPVPQGASSAPPS